MLVHDGTAYVESAQACGLHLTPREERRPEEAGTYGVGELVTAACEAGATRVVVGLGGSGTNDGGAGLLAALGATSAGGRPDRRRHRPRRPGERRPGRRPGRVAGVQLVAASDVDNPLLGSRRHQRLRAAEGRRRGPPPGGRRAAGAARPRHRQADGAGKGAGAAGGLGFALLLLGATRVPGLDVVAEAVGLLERARAANLVVTGEGAFDFSSRGGKVPYGVAEIAAQALQPCIALAGQVLVGSREMRALGVESAYSTVDLVGEEASFADPAGSLAALAERTARSWSR